MVAVLAEGWQTAQDADKPRRPHDPYGDPYRPHDAPCADPHDAPYDDPHHRPWPESAARIGVL